MQPEVGHHLLFDQKLHIIDATLLCFFLSYVLTKSYIPYLEQYIIIS